MKIHSIASLSTKIYFENYVLGTHKAYQLYKIKLALFLKKKKIHIWYNCLFLKGNIYWYTAAANFLYYKDECCKS